jgi:hypothetical protein
MPRTFANITLTSLDGDLSVVVFLPENVGDGDEECFYYGSRFEHGSMIGSITRRRRYTVEMIRQDGSSKQEEIVKTHVLYGIGSWRQPHNSQWPESGVGLASEFGVGDDGALCFFRCGWPEATDITNGVLGYQEANIGEPFLKIGVGALVKGTCPECDSTGDYKFNSPYMLAATPRWKMTRLATNSGNENSALQFEHEARLRNYGYKIVKDISLNNNILSMTTTLQNLGDEPFSTVWYSHHFFTCDGDAVGPGYSLDLNIKGDQNNPVYQEPGTWSWTTPLADYAKVKSYPNSVHIDMNRALDPGTRIKAEFADDHHTSGGFMITACETSIEARLYSPDFQPHNYDNSLISMYAYNLYIERGTFSPEPQILIRNLQPGQTTSWTLELFIKDQDNAFSSTSPSFPANYVDATPWWIFRGSHKLLLGISLGGYMESNSRALVYCYGGICAVISFVGLLALQRLVRRRSRRLPYHDIP